MDQERASIIKYFESINPVQLYFERIPEGMETPSMYFPIVVNSGEQDSLSTYTDDNQLLIKVFEYTTPKAAERAKAICDSIKKSRYKIPIINQDGTTSNLLLRVDKISYKEINDGVVQIELNWKSRHKFNTQQNVSKINKVILDIKI